MSPIVAQDYTQLIQSGGPVLIAFVVLFGAAYVLSVKAVLPAMRLAREITMEVSSITRTIKNKVERLESIAERFEAHAPKGPSKRPEKSIYDS